jgi:hypothetical protein
MLEVNAVVTPDWSASLAEVWHQLLWAFALGTALVCVLAAAALLWQRRSRTPDRARAAYYVARRDAAGVAVYIVAYSHVGRLPHPQGSALADPAWGAGADTEPLAEAMLGHHTGLRWPPERQLSALAQWLELQPGDGFVLESADLAEITGTEHVRPRSPAG